MADLGCAAGTDTIALARAGARVVAVDRDPVARELTRPNAAALGLADRVRVLDADVVELVAAAAAAGWPGARPRCSTPRGGRADAGSWTPTAGRRPWSTVDGAARAACRRRW